MAPKGYMVVVFPTQPSRWKGLLIQQNLHDVKHWLDDIKYHTYTTCWWTHISCVLILTPAIETENNYCLRSPSQIGISAYQNIHYYVWRMHVLQMQCSADHDSSPLYCSPNGSLSDAIGAVASPEGACGFIAPKHTQVQGSLLAYTKLWI